MIRCQGLRWGAPGQPLTPALDLNFPSDSLTAIINANGSGKSSLLKVIAGLQKPLTGKVALDVSTRGNLSFMPNNSTSTDSSPSACKRWKHIHTSRTTRAERWSWCVMTWLRFASTLLKHC
ncbi:hypothetical protein HK44_013145 [Pseudomonas fluorescens HK44]|uniref:ABC transporter domain-containing protein n=1 Tax=Pseudomonas fluorescens HK44 TaxID=1042209 RepID=A0A010T3S7_PSEFL|nr:hypothetical protein HK44_013145 [Pseudomonas fluorescens HK44]